MGWADNYIKDLREGKTVSFRPKGNSMTGLIESGDLVTVMSCCDDTIVFPRDIVLCKIGGYQYLHIVTVVDDATKRYQISNNHGRVNGWISRGNIFGKLVKVEK